MKPKFDPDFDWCLKLHVHTVLSQEDGVFLGMFRSPNMSEELEVLKKPSQPMVAREGWSIFQ